MRTIRLARQADVDDLLAIYAPYLSTTVTFEYVLPSREEFSRRIADVQARFPYLVLEEGGQPVGYAYAHPLGQRAAYQWSGELSIYLSPAAAGKGGGRPLYLALMELLRLQGMRTVYGVVTHPNPASEAFHAAMGFRLLGTQHNSGYKNGRWLDVALYEKPLSDYPDAPPVPVPLDQLPRETVEEVLAKYTQMLNETNRGRLP